MQVKPLVVSILFILTCFSSPGCRRSRQGEKEKAGTGTAGETAFFVEVPGEAIQMEPGSRALLSVKVQRKDYFGPITLELRNLPQGVTASPKTMGPREPGVAFELAASPGTEPGERKTIFVAGKGESADVEGKSGEFTVNIRPPSFTLNFDPPQLKLSPHEKAVLKVALKRNEYQGPIELKLDGLPPDLKAKFRSQAVFKGGKGEQPLVIDFESGAIGKQGESTLYIVAKAQEGLKVEHFYPYPLAVVGPPFALKVEPAAVKLVYGQKTRITISAQRRADFQDSIKVELQGLPKQVIAKPLGQKDMTLRQKDLVLELSALPSLKSGDPTVTVVGKEAGSSSSDAFALKLIGQPFKLALEAKTIDVFQGIPAKMKVTVSERSKDFQENILFEFPDLPKHLRVFSRGISAGEKTGEIEIMALPSAKDGEKSNLKIVALARVQGDTHRLPAGEIDLRVQNPFTLWVEPKVGVMEGSNTTFKVKAQRREFKNESIFLELKNLPKGVTGPSSIKLEKGKDSIDIELSADPKTGGRIKDDVLLVGTAGPDKVKVETQFSVRIIPKLFELEIQPNPLKVTTGGKTVLKVLAKRKEYDGPIVLEVLNLPDKVQAAKGIMPAKQNELDLEIAADVQPLATAVTKNDLHVQGTAVEAGKQVIPSSPFALRIEPGLFDLKVDPFVTLNSGIKAKLKVTVHRLGYQGPIALEVRNLPKGIAPARGTIPKDENQAEIEIESKGIVAEGDLVDLLVRGTANNNKFVQSSRFTLRVASIGEERQLDLKAAPIQIFAGGTAKVKISAFRKGYDGPIEVDLANLPAGLTAKKGLIPMGQNAVVIELTAAAKAEPGITPDVCVVGLAAANANRPYASPHIILTIQKK